MPAAERSSRIDMSERNARVVELYEAGETASQIALQLGGCLTRCAVLGVLHRHRKTKGLAPEHSPTTAARLARALRPTPSPAPMRPLVIRKYAAEKTESLRVTLEELAPHHCRWPLAGAKSFVYCGLPKSGRSYCEAHRQLAYTRASLEGALQKLDASERRSEGDRRSSHEQRIDLCGSKA